MKPEELEIILNELLKEQRDQGLLQSETVRLCREFNDQIIALKKPDGPKADASHEIKLKGIQMSCQMIAERQSAANKELQRMEHQLARLEILHRAARLPFENWLQFLKRWKKWLALAFVIFFFLPLILFFCTAKKVEKLKTGDLKYQYLKAFTDSSSRALLSRLDSAYAAAPDSLERLVKLAAKRKTPAGYGQDSIAEKRGGKDGIKPRLKRPSKKT